MILQEDFRVLNALCLLSYPSVPIGSKDECLLSFGSQDSPRNLPCCGISCNDWVMGGLGTTAGKDPVGNLEKFMCFICWFLSRLNGIYVSGASIGTLIIFTLAGYIADNLGWEAVFYVTGGSSLVWVVFWFYLVYDTPAQHPRIDKEEREYIESAIGEKYLDRKNLKTPWREIFTSLPVWGIVLGHAASNWGNYTLNQQVWGGGTLSFYHSSTLASNLSLQCSPL